MKAPPYTNFSVATISFDGLMFRAEASLKITETVG